jgi:5-methylcytosine-specific restriction protein A
MATIATTTMTATMSDVSRRLRALAPRIGRLDTRRIKPTPKVAAVLYRAREWRAVVAAVIAERGRRCQRCGRTHRPDGTPIRIFADHITELQDGGAALDARNIALLCGRCHTRKTAAERAKRR